MLFSIKILRALLSVEVANCYRLSPYCYCWAKDLSHINQIYWNRKVEDIRVETNKMVKCDLKY